VGPLDELPEELIESQFRPVMVTRRPVRHTRKVLPVRRDSPGIT
jgi:hypothetical protein